MKKGKLQEHLRKVHPRFVEKDGTFFKFKRRRLDRHTGGIFFQSSGKIVEASYKIAQLIAQNKKPHTIGKDLVKPCMLEAASLVLGPEAANKLKQISLSNNTISVRLDEMSDDIQDQVVMKNSPFFAIQLNDSVDVAQCPELLVFARYVTEKSVEEEFLFCKTLASTTKGSDIMEIVSAFFEEEKLSWKKLAAVCTDGGTSMLGCRSGFAALCKEKYPDIIITHCMIHREALASRTLPASLKETLDIVIQAVNFVKGSALNTRLFRQLCQHMDHENLLFHTAVRWLSKGNVLDRVFELREAIQAFLETQKSKKRTEELISAFQQPAFEFRLAFLADVFEALNSLNKKLQGGEKTIVDHTDAIKAFIEKLELWKRKLERGQVTLFRRLTESLGEEEVASDELLVEIKEHLASLTGEFSRYFPEFEDSEEIQLTLARNPFRCEVDLLPDDIQEEFLELKNSTAAKEEFLGQNVNYLSEDKHICFESSPSLLIDLFM